MCFGKVRRLPSEGRTMNLVKVAMRSTCLVIRFQMSTVWIHAQMMSSTETCQTMVYPVCEKCN